MADTYGVWCLSPHFTGWTFKGCEMTKEQAEQHLASLERGKDVEGCCRGPHEVRRSDGATDTT